MLNQNLFSTLLLIFTISVMILSSCANTGKDTMKSEQGNQAITQEENMKYPSDIMPFMDKWKILLGDGTTSNNLVSYRKEGFFYTSSEGGTDWVVYKTPNSGVTSKTSSNTRSELGEKKRWIPEVGGKLTGTCKVMHVSTSGDPRVAASYSVVVGQIHSEEGHKNEPCKIFYKKFPGHTKGSVFWNYEINTAGDDNSGRWDYSTPVWGYDFGDVSDSADEFPAEPTEGIELGEEFSYVINVHEGIMYLTFKSEGHPTKTFTKNLLESDYAKKADIPDQVRRIFGQVGQDGVERPEAYADEKQFFKQGAYNQTNGKPVESNIVWCAGADVYEGDIDKQYANGDYVEVWFREGSLSEGTKPVMK